MRNNVYYFVEGECEKKLIDLIKSNEFPLIISGVVKVKNVVIEKLTDFDINNLKLPKYVIFVYDTDNIKDLSILISNIDKIKKTKAKLLHLHSVLCFEDEIVRSTSIKKIDDFFKTIARKEFKSKFISCKNLKTKLLELKFDVNKIWNARSNLPQYQSFIDKIKTKK